MIVDGDDDEDNDCEQSDMVQLLLNVAFAPTDVVERFNFGPGICTEFRNMMEESTFIERNLVAPTPRYMADSFGKRKTISLRE